MLPHEDNVLSKFRIWKEGIFRWGKTVPVTWSDEKFILLFCPGRGLNSRPPAHRGVNMIKVSYALTTRPRRRSRKTPLVFNIYSSRLFRFPRDKMNYCELQKSACNSLIFRHNPKNHLWLGSSTFNPRRHELINPLTTWTHNCSSFGALDDLCTAS